MMTDHSLNRTGVTKEVREAKPKKKSRNASDRVHLLTLEQARQFLRAAQSDPLEAFYILALTTGLRWGDLLTLKWEDIDHTHAGQEACGTILQKEQGRLQISEQKTKMRRCIVLTKLVLEALTRHRLRQDEQRLTKGELWEDHDLVFCNAVGNPLNANYIRCHSFIPLRERIGLPFMRFHDLRPSAVRLLCLAGAHPKVVQEIFGYRQRSMAGEVDISPPMLLSLQEEAVQQLNTMLLEDSFDCWPSSPEQTTQSFE